MIRITVAAAAMPIYIAMTNGCSCTFTVKEVLVVVCLTRKKYVMRVELIENVPTALAWSTYVNEWDAPGARVILVAKSLPETTTNPAELNVVLSLTTRLAGPRRPGGCLCS